LPKKTFRDIGKDEPLIRAALESAIGTLAARMLERQHALQAIADRGGLGLFGQMVNNQPQLNFDFARNFRDDLFGPDTLSGRLAYEWGFGNLNAFDRYDNRFGGHCVKVRVAIIRSEAPKPADLDACLEAFGDYATQNKAEIMGGARVAISAGFTKSAKYHYLIEPTGEVVDFREGTLVTLSVDFGRLIGVRDDGTAGARLDLAARYENPQTGRGKDRFVASATLTKKIGDVSVPFGLVYANRREFLGDVDHQLSATVGLKLNLFPKVP
jgi:hypothetical protein